MTTMDSTPGPVTVTGPAPPSSLPASPTLTNPDMILPDYPDYDHSPSPVRLDDPRSQLNMWRNPQAGHASADFNAMYNGQQQQHQFHDFSFATPTTPIIYGNGTMLSDIGEVTEVESTPGKPSPPHRLSAFQMPSQGLKVVDNSEGDAALRSSPTIGKGAEATGVKKRAKEHAAQRERRDSFDSNSTIRDDRERVAVLADFNDTASVGDSVFQGDDEESLASSYVDDSSSVAEGRTPTAAGLASGLNGQKYSTAQLSKRAEQILANAKKRLTTMEDNLSKARSSVIVAAPYSGSDASTPSPPIVRASSALIQSTTGPVSPATGHHRIGSENSLRIGLPIKVYPPRSSSVLGVQSIPRQPLLTVSKSADQLHGQYNRQRTSYIMREASLEPLGEDDVSPSYARSGLGGLKRNSSVTSPTHSTPGNRGLSRSASVTHMSDIKDQVRDLKGKISSLREQARADSLKRRSLQSLRTPSPFTHSYTSPWHPESTTEPKPTTSFDSSHDVPVGNAEGSSSGGGSPVDQTLDPTDENEIDKASDNIDTPLHPEDLDGEESDQFNYDTLDRVPYADEADLASDDADLVTENGDTDNNVDNETAEYEDAIDDGYDVVSESGDSIYHESVQEQLSHEDREDAFDYEHFFLHSAMGTISQGLARRDSLSSYTSEGSVETARGPLGPVAEEDYSDANASPALLRRPSDASISTVASFATANEDPSSRQPSTELIRAEEEDRVEPEAFPLLYATSTTTERNVTPPIAKQAPYQSVGSPSYATQLEQRGARHQDELHSAMRRPTSSNAATRPHRPSVSSFESTGTTRSFPLVKRSSKTSSSGIPTPEGGLSDHEAKTGSSPRSSTRTSPNSGSSASGHKHNISLQSTGSTTSIMQEDHGTSAIMETLPRDDQFLVERLVASLGRCVLGLAENGRASTEARMYRRRIEAARRILEGQLEPAL